MKKIINLEKNKRSSSQKVVMSFKAGDDCFDGADSYADSDLPPPSPELFVHEKHKMSHLTPPLRSLSPSLGLTVHEDPDQAQAPTFPSLEVRSCEKRSDNECSKLLLCSSILLVANHVRSSPSQDVPFPIPTLSSSSSSNLNTNLDIIEKLSSIRNVQEQHDCLLYHLKLCVDDVVIFIVNNDNSMATQESLGFTQTTEVWQTRGFIKVRSRREQYF